MSTTLQSQSGRRGDFEDKFSQKQDLRAENNPTKSYNFNYHKCQMSYSAKKQGILFNLGEDYQPSQQVIIGSGTVQSTQNKNKVKNLLGSQLNLAEKKQQLTSRNGNSILGQKIIKQDSSSSIPQRLVSLALPAPMVGKQYSCVSTNQKQLIENPQKLSDILLHEQKRQQTYMKINSISSNQDNFFGSSDYANSRIGFSNVDKDLSIQTGSGKQNKFPENNQNNNKSEMSSIRKRIQSAKSVSKLSSHSNFTIGGQTSQSKFGQNRNLAAIATNNEFSKSIFSNGTQNAQSVSNSDSQSKKLSIKSPTSCLIWNKETQNLILKMQRPQTAAKGIPEKKLNAITSTQHIKQAQISKLKSMINRETIIEHPKQIEELEFHIPNDLKNVSTDIDKELERVMLQFMDENNARETNKEIQKRLNARIRNGAGACFLDNGDLYSGQWKEGKREGMGVCKFYTGGYYKGDWVQDQFQGNGIQVLKSGIAIQCKFEEGKMNILKQVKIMYTNGEYFEGYIDHEYQRRGSGKMFYKNGDFYDGQWFMDKREGDGKIIFANGAEYTGDFQKDEINGDGVYIDQDKNRHEVVKKKGFFKNGVINGQGRIYFSNRDVYEGEFNDGYFSGQGVMKYRNIEHPIYGTDIDAEYQGKWKLGRKHGFGKMFWSDRTEFKGQWENDQKKFGKLTNRMNREYYGEFKNDLYDGKGKITMTEKKVTFEGIFKEGICPNTGKLTNIEKKEVYEGEINTDFQKHGKGKLHLQNGDTYEGDFFCDAMQGQGIYRYSNGDFYHGEFIRNVKNGQGRMYYAATQIVFEGRWREDDKDGEGTQYKPNGTEKRGIWKGNKVTNVAQKENHDHTAAQNLEKLFDWQSGSKKQKQLDSALKLNY